MFAGFLACSTVVIDVHAAQSPTTIVGRVLDERRFPVAGVEVAVLGPAPVPPLRLVTDTDGSFPFEGALTPADAEVLDREILVTTADRRIGRGRAWLPADFLARLRRHELSEPILLAPCGRVVVDVRDGERVVAGARVELREPGHGAVAIAAAVTDARGRAVIDPAPIGEFTLFALEPDRARATAEARVESGATFEASVQLRPLRSLAIEVVDVDDGRPIAGAVVSVDRSAKGADPGTFPGRHRAEICVVDPARTDERGRVEVRGLETGSRLMIGATAPHYANYWFTPRDGSEDSFPFSKSRGTGREVSADDGSVRLEMKRRPTSKLRFPIEGSGGPIPPDGTELALCGLNYDSRRNREGVELSNAKVRDGAVEFIAEFAPAEVEGRAPILCWMQAPDGSIAELTSGARAQEGTARFAPVSALKVRLLAPGGSPMAGRRVRAVLEQVDRGDALWPESDDFTDADGVARFAGLRAGRWFVDAPGAFRIVEMQGADVAIELRPPAPVEVVFAITLEGERRLPASFYLTAYDDDASLRREDPARGEVHLLVPRTHRNHPLRFYFNSVEWGQVSRPLPDLPESGALVVPIALQHKKSCEVVAHVHGLKLAPEVSWESQVVLERLDEASGNFEPAARELDFRLSRADQSKERCISNLMPGVWRLAIPEAGVHGEPVRVATDGPPAELAIDASSLAAVNVFWKVPDGENAQFLALVRPVTLPRIRWWQNWQEAWPLEIENSYESRSPFAFDRAHPPPLRIEHPYLVSSPLNDSIDLTKPRSAITLHLDVGPLLTFTPEWHGDLPAVHGAWVTLAEGADPKPRPALRRGWQFVMSPPPAGRRRVLIDPVVAAPAELESVAFDGGAQDLGPIRFARGTTLTVHARAKAPFGAPRTVARATRLDGLAYERASSPDEGTSSPFDLKIRALGPGRFRVVLVGNTGNEWAAEIEVDGVHDAELTILTD